MFISRKREPGPDLFGSFAFGTGQDHGDDGADAERRHDDVLAFRSRLYLQSGLTRLSPDLTRISTLWLISKLRYKLKLYNPKIYSPIS